MKLRQWRERASAMLAMARQEQGMRVEQASALSGVAETQWRRAETAFPRDVSYGQQLFAALGYYLEPPTLQVEWNPPHGSLAHPDREAWRRLPPSYNWENWMQRAGVTLLARRITLRLTVTEAAVRARMSPSIIRRLERCKQVSYPTVERLAEALGMGFGPPKVRLLQDRTGKESAEAIRAAAIRMTHLRSLARRRAYVGRRAERASRAVMRHLPSWVEERLMSEEGATVEGAMRVLVGMAAEEQGPDGDSGPRKRERPSLEHAQWWEEARAGDPAWPPVGPRDEEMEDDDGEYEPDCDDDGR